MSAFLGPIVEERRLLAKEGKPLPDDMLQWMIEKTTKHGITDIEHISAMQLLLTFAAIHTTTLSATAMWVDLVSAYSDHFIC